MRPAIIVPHPSDKENPSDKEDLPIRTAPRGLHETSNVQRPRLDFLSLRPYSLPSISSDRKSPVASCTDETSKDLHPSTERGHSHSSWPTRAGTIMSESSSFAGRSPVQAKRVVDGQCGASERPLFLARGVSHTRRSSEHNAAHEETMLDEACCGIAFVGAPELIYRFAWFDESHGVWTDDVKRRVSGNRCGRSIRYARDTQQPYRLAAIPTMGVALDHRGPTSHW
jgi:hypothetical protein